MLNNQRIATGVLALVALALVVLIGRDVFLPPPVAVATVSTANVVRGTVRQAVSGTGTVVPAGQLNVSFRAGGLLTEIGARVGDHVTAGQVLARIDSTSQQNALASAQANLASANANYQNAVTPLTAAQIAQLQHNIAAAQTSLVQTIASNNLTSQLDAAQIPIDQQQLQTDQTQMSTDQTLVNNDQNTVNADQIALNNGAAYQSDLYNLQTFQNQLAIDTAHFQQDGCGSQTYPYTGACASDFSAVSSDQRNVNTYQTRVVTDSAQLTADQVKLTADQNKVTIDQQKINTDQNRVTADQNKIAQDQITAQRSVTSGQASIQSAQDALAVQTTTKSSTIDAAAASIQSSTVAVSTAQLALDQTTLYAPTDGTVLSLNGQVGEVVGAGSGTTAQAPGSSAPQPSTGSGAATGFMTLASTGGMQVVVPFAESDAGRVAANQTATIGFDAVSGLNVPAHVLAVAASSTTVSNVVNYYATLTLDRNDARIKQGMTANISLIVAQAANVLTITNRAITRVGQLSYVTVLRNGQQVRTAVQLGTAGDTTTEIKSGLIEGDKVVIPTLKAPSRSATATPGGLLGGGGGGGGGGVRVGG